MDIAVEQKTARSSIRTYFRQLHARLALGLVVCLVIPNAVVSVYFYRQLTHGSYDPSSKGRDTLVTRPGLFEGEPPVMQRLSTPHAQVARSRLVLACGLVVINLSILLSVLLATRRLIRKARATAERGQTLEHQLIHASKLASLGELATGVAHEINNPLAIITATTGVIRDMFNPAFTMDPKPEDVIAELDIVDEAAFRARNITRQLLDMGRNSSPHPEPVCVNSLIDDVLKGLKEREFTLNDIDIIKEYDEHLPQINADRDRLRQVFLNLLNNAGDAIRGSGTIAVSTQASGGCVRVLVSDTGEGIESENMTRIFSPFFTTKGVGKGTGLGLSISANIVEGMGGKLTVESTVGKGSVFTVSLPIHHGEGG